MQPRAVCYRAVTRDTTDVDKSAPPIWVFITFRLGLAPDSSIDVVRASLDEAVGRGTIQRLKAGHTNVKAETLVAIAEKIGCQPSDLLMMLRGQSPVAHGVSHPLPIMKPRLRSWEEAVETRERAPFALEIRDRALGDAHPVGNVGVFVPQGEPQSGDAVLVLAADGQAHLRYYEAGLAGEWRGVSNTIGYPPITGEILAVMATSMRRGLYDAM